MLTRTPRPTATEKLAGGNDGVVKFAVALALFTALIAGPTHPVVAQPSPATQPSGLPGDVTTQHELTLPDGSVLAYQATAGVIHLRNDRGQALAEVFYIAYEKTEPDDSDSATQPAHAARRPVTFCFNGGPGSSSVWLHMGAFGPKRIVLEDDGTSPGPPYALADNPTSPLAVSDLVFIDPVSTGYSRPTKRAKPDRYHSVRGDVASIAEFIHRYLSQHDRWLSPRFIAGESYGTLRAAALGEHLASEHHIHLNGLILVSPVLDFQTLQADAGNTLPNVLFLATFAAVAHYHGQLDDELQAMAVPELMGEVRRFAHGPYDAALDQGRELDDGTRQRMTQQLARYTGLPPRVIAEENLRVPAYRFRKELLRDEGRILGRFDARLTRPMLEPAMPYPQGDPSYQAVRDAFTAGLNHHLRTALDYRTQRPYVILNRRLNWDFQAQNDYTEAQSALRRLMQSQPKLNVFLAGGYYDLATPIDVTRWSLDHGLPNLPIEGRFDIRDYAGGHMMYTLPKGRRTLNRHLRRFITRQLQDP